MTLMEWAIDVPQKLLQCDAIPPIYFWKLYKLGLGGANHQRKLLNELLPETRQHEGGISSNR